LLTMKLAAGAFAEDAKAGLARRYLDIG
jgi:hypothetical protein